MRRVGVWGWVGGDVGGVRFGICPSLYFSCLVFPLPSFSIYPSFFHALLSFSPYTSFLLYCFLSPLFSPPSHLSVSTSFQLSLQQFNFASQLIIEHPEPLNTSNIMKIMIEILKSMVSLPYGILLLAMHCSNLLKYSCNKRMLCEGENVITIMPANFITFFCSRLLQF